MRHPMPTLVLVGPVTSQRDHQGDRWLLWFPIVGWIIAGCRGYARVHRAQEQVASQLRARKWFPVDEWKDIGVSPESAERVAKALADRMTWLPNHHLLPG